VRRRDVTKKVADADGGVGFVCPGNPKSNTQSHHNPNYITRYMLSLMICDFTGATWVTAFNEHAETILGNTKAEQLEHGLVEGGDSQFLRVFQAAQFKTYLFKLRAQMAYVQDEWRERVHVVSVEIVDFKKEGHQLLKDILHLEKQ